MLPNWKMLELMPAIVIATLAMLAIANHVRVP